MARGPRISDTIMEYLSSHIGEDLHVGRIASDLGLHTVQVASCMLRLRRDNPILNDEIQVIIRGSCWRYRPRPLAPITASVAVPAPVASPSVASPSVPPTVKLVPELGEIYERVGRVGDDVVVKGEDECLYRLVPLQ